MKALIRVLLMLLLPMVAQAGGGPLVPGDQRVVVRVDHESPALSADISWVSIRVPVEGLAVRVVLKCKESEPDARLMELERADKALRESPMPGTTLIDTPTMDLMPQKNGDIDEHSPGDFRGMPLVRCIAFPATRVGSLNALNKAVKEYLAQLKLPKNVTAEADAIMAVLGNPQQHRGKMLSLIQADVAQIKSAFGTNTVVKLDGLQNPLRARLVNDREAELSVGYRMAVEIR